MVAKKSRGKARKATTAKPKAAKQPEAARLMDATRWLQAALTEAAESGWTADLPRQAAARLSADPALAVIVFPEGTRGIVAALNGWADAQMLARIEGDAGYPYLKVRQKIAFAMRARLEALEPYKPGLARLPGWATRPGRGLQLLKAIWATADAAWYEAGDTATDYNHYTKRLLLAAVLVATKLFWLRDESHGSAATWAYLDARIDDVMQLGQKLSGWKQMAGMAEKFMKMRRSQ